MNPVVNHWESQLKSSSFLIEKPQSNAASFSVKDELACARIESARDAILLFVQLQSGDRVFLGETALRFLAIRLKQTW